MSSPFVTPLIVPTRDGLAWPYWRFVSFPLMIRGAGSTTRLTLFVTLV